MTATALALSGCDLGTANASPARGNLAPDQDAHALVANGAMLLDVRTPGEFSRGHLPDAVNIPVSELAGRLDELPADRPVVVYCRSGHRSGIAARALRTHGVKTVVDVGAMSSW
jgi:rhodanese-related sulfurtransferase